MTFNITFKNRTRMPSPSLLHRASFGAVTTALVCLALPARANPRPLPYSYPYETLPAEEAELETYVDITPVRIVDPEDATGNGRIWDQQYRLQTEFEYGITDRLELGLYLVLANEAGGPLAFDGFVFVSPKRGSCPSTSASTARSRSSTTSSNSKRRSSWPSGSESSA
jgi:hypothetical protein